jgi:hypothetical protein
MHPPESLADTGKFNGRPLLDSMGAALFGCGGVWLMQAGSWQAQQAVASYGHNVDSGALEWAVALFYLGPASLLFALASVAGWRGWRIVRAARWIAIGFALLPPVLSLATCAVWH